MQLPLQATVHGSAEWLVQLTIFSACYITRYFGLSILEGFISREIFI